MVEQYGQSGVRPCYEPAVVYTSVRCVNLSQPVLTDAHILPINGTQLLTADFCYCHLK
jgi:hypothetical protein